MRGVTPNGVTFPRGAISVIVPPGPMPSLRGEPRADDDGVAAAKLRQRAARQRVRNRGQRIQIARANAAHDNARRGAPPDASACPSTIGATRNTPGTARTRARPRRNPGDCRRSPCTMTWPCRPENAREQLVAKAVHHRHDDDERRHAERDADQRKSGNDGDEALRPLGAQIAQRDHPLERGERARRGARLRRDGDRHTLRGHDHACRVRLLLGHQGFANLATALSSDTSSFAPVARTFTSTSPFSRPRGPTTI